MTLADSLRLVEGTVVILNCHNPRPFCLGIQHQPLLIPPTANSLPLAAFMMAMHCTVVALQNPTPTMGIPFTGKKVKVWVHIINVNFNFHFNTRPKVGLRIIFEILQ